MGGSSTPGSGKSRGGKELDFWPLSQLKKPLEEEDDCEAIVLELTNLAGNLLLVRPYSHGLTFRTQQISFHFLFTLIKLYTYYHINDKNRNALPAK